LFAVNHRPLLTSHPWHGVTALSEDPKLVHAFIEMLPTGEVKYEVDKPSGLLRLDRPQQFSSLCPALYGFIPQTWCDRDVAARCMSRTALNAIVGDGDPMDICVLTNITVPYAPFLVDVRPIGGFRMIDNGEADDKIIAVMPADSSFGHMHELSDCPRGLIERLEHYFLTYKQSPRRPARAVQIAEEYGAGEAWETIRASQRDYRNGFGGGEE
jgi:inorganic pyrophosphatase